ncbi:hypothetical protein Taro_049047, partial [Colocasia esculenta]|nr:hypothetical protein [Colocasia esculenta]
MASRRPGQQRQEPSRDRAACRDGVGRHDGRGVAMGQAVSFAKEISGVSRKILRTRRTPVRVATGSGQNATRGCEERDKAVRTGREIATGRSSHSECDGFAVTTRPQNAAYRVVAFTGSVPESDRERH